MKTMIENSKKLTKILETLNKEADWQPYNANIWDFKSSVKLQGYYSEQICEYLSNNGYQRQNGRFTEYNNGDGVEIVLT